METVSLPHPNKLVVVEPLDYSNTYNYHLPHRHDYFEVLFITKGSGHQFIDFSRYELSAGELYVVYPGQIHLMVRGSAEGILLQFRKEVFDIIFPLKHHQLYFLNPKVELPDESFRLLYSLMTNIFDLLQLKGMSPLSFHKVYSYLQIILISLIEHNDQQYSLVESHFPGHFMSLLGQHIKEKRKVTDYAAMMQYSTDKFMDLCKSSFGKTPLKLIHEELLLEIRRLMMLNQLSLKEIAYELNFDSTANFSAFIKSVTDKTPKELQAALVQCYQ